MGENVKQFGNEVSNRWKGKMPKFFKKVMWACGLVSGTALAANEALTMANIQPHQWWTDILPYLIAIPAGAMFACKFTVEGGFPEDDNKYDE